MESLSLKCAISLIADDIVKVEFKADMPESEIMPGKNQNFKGISISKELYHKVKTFVDDNPEYRSIADFVSEAARTRMEQVEKNKAAKVQAAA